MKIHKQLAALALALVLCAAPAATVHAAHPVPDLNREDGSISATMTYDSHPVGGGSLTIYQVGDIAEEDGNYYFILSNGFQNSGLASDGLKTNEEVSDPDLASALAAYASDNSLAGTTVTIGNDGKVEITNLKMGLYLIVQNTPANGFEAISPFLVSLPMYMEVYDEATGEMKESYVYNVNVESKMSELTKKPTPTNPPGGGSDPDPDPSTDPTPTPASATPVTPVAPANPVITPAAPEDTDPSKLPQTGQLNWPVPVLAAMGLCLILAGWTLRCGGQRKHYGA